MRTGTRFIVEVDNQFTAPSTAPPQEICDPILPPVRCIFVAVRVAEQKPTARPRETEFGTIGWRTSNIARAYNDLAHQRREAVLQYSDRVLRRASKPTVHRGDDGFVDIIIHDDARATVEEVKAVISCVMPGCVRPQG